jgi:hypothetical protein
VQPVDQDFDDDDLYDWFINAMAEEFGSAEEVRPGAAPVWSMIDGKTDPRPFELRVTTEQLRSVAYSSVNVFDDAQAAPR